MVRKAKLDAFLKSKPAAPINVVVHHLGYVPAAQPAAQPAQPVRPDRVCAHSGEKTGGIRCKTCGGGDRAVTIAVFACNLHEKCTRFPVNPLDPSDVKTVDCDHCPDYL